MSDNEQQPPKPSSKPSADVAEGKKLPRTTGEKIFDFTDWYGMGWLANAAISVVATDYLANKRGAFSFDQAASNLKDNPVFRVGDVKNVEQALNGAKAYKELGDVLRSEVAAGRVFDVKNEQHLVDYHNEVDKVFKILKTHQKDLKEGKIPEEFAKMAEKAKVNPEHLLHGVEEVLSKSKAKSMLTLLSLMSGGFAIMVPIKVLEDHKEQIVSSLDNALGKNNKSLDEQHAIEARHKQIAEEPNQTWASVLGGRVIALVPVLTLTKVLGSKDNPLASVGFKGMDVMFEEAGKHAVNVFDKAMPETSQKIQDTFDKTNATLVEDVKAKILKSDLPTALVDSLKPDAMAKEEQNIDSVLRMAEKAAESFQMSAKSRMNKIAGYSIYDVSLSLLAASITMVASKTIAPLFDKGGRPEDFAAVGVPVDKEDNKAKQIIIASPTKTGAPEITLKNNTPSANLPAAPLSHGAVVKDESLMPYVVHGHAMKHEAHHHVPSATVSALDAQHKGQADVTHSTHIQI